VCQRTESPASAGHHDGLTTEANMQKIVLIGASAGGVRALTSITAALPADLPATVLIVMHVGARRSELPEILQKRCPLPVRHAQDREPLLPAQVLVAPPDCHLTVEKNNGEPRARLWHGPKENHTRPAIDPLFRSAAAEFDGHVIAAILTGYLDDGTAGLQAVKACGGYAVVQDPSDAHAPDMPASAIAYVAVDKVLALDDIGPALAAQVARTSEIPGPRQDTPPPRTAIPEWMEVENRAVRGAAGIEDLQHIGIPSGFTCPECDGALWRINGSAPPRFRCHTGHSFSMRILAELQDETVETAFWSSLKALQEKACLAREMSQIALAAQDMETAKRHAARAEEIQADIDTLHTLLSKRPR
jgi:two-component system chemotaxis response regulator CheB